MWCVPHGASSIFYVVHPALPQDARLKTMHKTITNVKGFGLWVKSICETERPAMIGEEDFSSAVTILIRRDN
jgi:hypothetical protein